MSIEKHIPLDLKAVLIYGNRVSHRHILLLILKYVISFLS